MLTFLHSIRIITPILETPHVFCESHTSLELLIQYITLVQEQNELDVRKQLVGADHLPQKDAVFLFSVD